MELAKELQYALEHPTHGHAEREVQGEKQLRRARAEQEISAQHRDETLKHLATQGSKFNMLPSTMLQKAKRKSTRNMKKAASTSNLHGEERTGT